MKHKNLPILKTIILIMSLIIVSTIDIFAQTIIKTIPAPNYPYGVTHDGEYLWVGASSTGSNKIWKINPADGSIAGSIDVPFVPPTGSYTVKALAMEGPYMWVFMDLPSANHPDKFYKIDPASGAILKTVNSPQNDYIGGMDFFDDHLWVSIYYSSITALKDVIIKLDTNGVIQDTIKTVGEQPMGLAYDGISVWCVEDTGYGANRQEIYEYDHITGTYTGNFARAPHKDPRDMAFDGQYFWMVAYITNTSVLYQFSMKGGTPYITLPVKFYDFNWVSLVDSSEYVATIQNTGSDSLSIDSVKILYSTNYSIDLLTPIKIPIGSSHNFKIKFKPTFYGIDSTQIVLYHNDPTRPPQTIRVHGKGMYPPAYIFTPDNYDFGVRRVNSTSTWKVKVENRGSQPLTITSGSFATVDFYIEPGMLPMTIDPVSSKNLRVWYYPKSSSAALDTLVLLSNAANLPQAKLVVTGQGDATPLAIGTPMWNINVPNHPNSNYFRTVKAVRSIGDITGDGKPDVIISTENYWTMAVNGNSSVDNDSLWAFNTYISSSSAGSIGANGDFSYQKALAIASDLNGDGFNDVVIGTGGGNEHVYAISGKTGQMIWTYGTDDPGSYGLGDFTGVDVNYDFNNDGVPDVVAAASATESGGLGGRRSVYLFNGTNGDIIWQSPLLGFTHAVAAIKDVDGDNIPDVIGAVGEPSYKVSAFSGVDGSLMWDFSLAGTGGGKELLVLPKSATEDDIIVGAFWGPIHRINPVTGIAVWSRPTGSGGVIQLVRLKDITGDGIDEILAALLGPGAWCINGATGEIIWTVSSGNTEGIASIPDLDGDKIDDVIIASQAQGTLIVKGIDGQLLTSYSFGGTIQCREVSFVPDIDGNYSYEIVVGSNGGHVALLSGGLNAPPVPVTASVSINAGWNLISVPLVRDDNFVQSIYPTAIGGTTYYFHNGYNPTDTLIAGKGYWTKFPLAISQNIQGLGMLNVSVPVNQGWNIIGSVQNEVPVPSGGIVASNVYSYSNGYQITNTLKPGKGYWVKTSAAGNITLGGTFKAIAENYDDKNSITIVDRIGNIQTLYFADTEKISNELEYFEMPPVPPSMVFDARFSSNRILEAFSNEDNEGREFKILLQSAKYPIEIAYNIINSDGKSFELIEKVDGEVIIAHLLKGSGKVKIASEDGKGLFLKIGDGLMLPENYGLSQNYPNPFNPVTTIRYQLPVDSRVTIRIFNSIGQEVKTLIDEIQDAGYKSIEWNSVNNLGNPVASGIYFYRIDASSVAESGKVFKQVKKMFLIK